MLSVGNFPRSNPRRFELALAVAWLYLRDAARTCLGIVLYHSLCTPALSVGAGISIMALTLAESTHKPSSVAMCPTNGTFCCRRLSLC